MAGDNYYKVSEIIDTVFPRGTGRTESSSSVPVFPTDLFAACAYLLKVSNSYTDFIPDGKSEAYPDKCYQLSAELVKSWVTMGEKWKTDRHFSTSELQKFWDIIYLKNGHEFAKPRSRKKDINLKIEDDWRFQVYKLMVIADEACEGFGFSTLADDPKKSKNWFEKLYLGATYKGIQIDSTDKDNHQKLTDTSPSISLWADIRVVCVQYKSRISDVGCTTRVFSKYLALLPGISSIQTTWQPPFSNQFEKNIKDLNILFVPFPFSIKDDYFEAHEVNNGSETDSPWGWFEFKNKLLNEPEFDIKFLDFIKALIIKNLSSTPIHIIVLPELAINYRIYEALVKKIQTDQTFDNLEILISGSNSNCNGDKGNFSISTEFTPRFNCEEERYAVTKSSAKHHRWRINKPQIESYQLENTLNTEYLWWEQINIFKREVKMSMFRHNSVFGIMICEDLARSDPCHEIFRALGANIVFGLLFDGPQIENRWPERYAKTLTEDPGTAVFTFTSQALIRRTNNYFKSDEDSWAIGLWQDEHGTRKEIKCEKGFHATVVSLKNQKGRDQTIDGRSNNNVIKWEYEKQSSIKLTKKEYEHLEILDQ